MTGLTQSSADRPVSYRWILERIIIPIVILGFGAWMTALNARITAINVSVQTLEQKVAGQRGQFCQPEPAARQDRKQARPDYRVTVRRWHIWKRLI